MKKKLVWDKTGERLYETGVSQGVLTRFRPAAYITLVPHGTVLVP